MSVSKPSVNRQFLLAAVPQGLAKESDFRLVETPIAVPQDGEILLQSVYWSVDPYMRGRMTGIKTYADPVKIGELMVGAAVGKVIESRHPDYEVGDYAVGYWGWQEFAVSNGRGLQKLDPKFLPVSTALSVLGGPGMTAYFGFLELCQPKQGETVVVSGAAGAVGSLVGQIAKVKGCRAIGIAGTDDKVTCLVQELGFDAAFNYKTTTDYTAKLKELCPRGVDCYFYNVGGKITDAVFGVLSTFARVAVCGQISQYNLEKPEQGPRLLRQVLIKQARVEGFIATRFANRFAEGYRQLATWVKEGKLKYHEHIVEGFENMPKAFIAMLEGHNTGKMLVKARDVL
jgi:NADPH-dependent curcumin reductase CurA